MCRKASPWPLLSATKPNYLARSNQAIVPVSVMRDLRERKRQHSLLGCTVRRQNSCPTWSLDDDSKVAPVPIGKFIFDDVR
jgi:hypothetical protein